MSMFNGHEPQIKKVLDSALTLIFTRIVMPTVVTGSIAVAGYFGSALTGKLDSFENFIVTTNGNVVTINNNLNAIKRELESTIEKSKSELEKSVMSVKGELNTEIQLRALSDEELRRRIRELERNRL